MCEKIVIKRGVLTQVAQFIESIPQKQIQSNIAACTEILARLVLEKQIIVSILREEIMREKERGIKFTGVASMRDDVNFIKSKVKIKKSKFTGNSNNPKSKIQNYQIIP